LYRQSRYAMGSVCEIQVWCRSADEARRAFATGFAEIHRNEQVFSAYREDSELAMVNREAGSGPVPVTEEFFNLTQYAVRSWRWSLGALDVTVGPLMKAWGFWKGEPRMPSRTEFLEAQNLVGCNKVSLDRRGRTVQFQRQGMELDFGGLAKGHAAKRVARVLQKQGVLAALVDLGSSSLCASEVTPSAAAHKPHRETGVEIGEWPIGVAHPSDATQCPVYLLLEPGWALSTSGTYEQQFEIDGKKFSHILDPRTGWPLNGLRSVTAVTRSGRRSEALTKQLLILSSMERAALVQRFKNFDWAHLEVSPTGALAIDVNFRRTNLLVSSNRQT
jgi:thiamine biosynthesis lipoprotein